MSTGKETNIEANQTAQGELLCDRDENSYTYAA